MSKNTLYIVAGVAVLAYLATRSKPGQAQAKGTAMQTANTNPDWWTFAGSWAGAVA